MLLNELAALGDNYVEAWKQDNVSLIFPLEVAPGFMVLITYDDADAILDAKQGEFRASLSARFGSTVGLTALHPGTCLVDVATSGVSDKNGPKGTFLLSIIETDQCPDSPNPDDCPGSETDTDGDGVPDDVDRCLQVFGDPVNNGCPASTGSILGTWTGTVELETCSIDNRIPPEDENNRRCTTREQTWSWTLTRFTGPGVAGTTSQPILGELTLWNFETGETSVCQSAGGPCTNWTGLSTLIAQEDAGSFEIVIGGEIETRIGDFRPFGNEFYARYRLTRE